MTGRPDRRTVLVSTASLAAWSLWPAGCATAPPPELESVGRKKRPALVRGAFFYPPAADVLAGKCEDGWARHKWFTWPGNQYEPEAQQARFVAELRRIAAGLDVELALDERPICTGEGVQAFLAGLAAPRPDALLLFDFWNSFAGKLKPILQAYAGPVILYHPVGANHQLPPEPFRTSPRVFYIHSIENWDALERGLRAVHARTRLAQSRLLRVSGRLREETDATEPLLGTAIHGVPADHFNRLFDETAATPELERLAGYVRRRAGKITGLEEAAFTDGVRAHAAVRRLMARHEADAITIECLLLGHRKPCLSFALLNGGLVPCGCENDLNATLGLMLGEACFGRGGFQHNPDFDTERSLYFASHCTCPVKLHGPGGEEAPHELRPFMHQLPRTLALDVKWPAGETVTLCKYHSGQARLDAWRGEVVSSPDCPPVGGCATRVLVRIAGVADVCAVYPGPHPILYCGDFAPHLKAFARLYGLEIRTNC